MNLPKCPKCGSEYTYEDGSMLVCPECFYEWILERSSENEENVVKDANGNILQNGDSVTIIKDLKVKGASNDLKRGTKVKNIRLIDDGIHNIDCKIDGFGAMKLKSEFVKKNQCKYWKIINIIKKRNATITEVFGKGCLKKLKNNVKTIFYSFPVFTL